MASIHHQVEIRAPLARVYEAIATPEGITTWWDKQTLTRTDGGVILGHTPGPEHGVVKLRVVELVPARRVEWECVSTHPRSSPASAFRPFDQKLNRGVDWATPVGLMTHTSAFIFLFVARAKAKCSRPGRTDPRRGAARPRRRRSSSCSARDRLSVRAAAPVSRRRLARSRSAGVGDRNP